MAGRAGDEGDLLDHRPAGDTWADVDIDGTRYCPRSVHLPDGRVPCVEHRGSPCTAIGREEGAVIGWAGMAPTGDVVQTWAAHYNTVRPDQSLGKVPLGQESWPAPNSVRRGDVGLVRKRSYLAGLLNHCERKAA